MIAVLLSTYLVFQSAAFSVAPANPDGLRAIGITNEGIVYFANEDAEVFEWDAKRPEFKRNPNLREGIFLNNGSILIAGSEKWSRTHPSQILRRDGSKITMPRSFSAWNEDKGRVYGQVGDEAGNQTRAAVYHNGKILELKTPTLNKVEANNSCSFASWREGVIGWATFTPRNPVGEKRGVQLIYWRENQPPRVIPAFPEAVHTQLVGVANERAYANLEFKGSNRAALVTLSSMQLLPLPEKFDSSSILAANGDLAVGSVYSYEKGGHRACAWLKGKFIDLTQALGVAGIRLVSADSVNSRGEILCFMDVPDGEKQAIVVRPRLK